MFTFTLKVHELIKKFKQIQCVRNAALFFLKNSLGLRICSGNLSPALFTTILDRSYLS